MKTGNGEQRKGKAGLEMKKKEVGYQSGGLEGSDRLPDLVKPKASLIRTLTKRGGSPPYRLLFLTPALAYH